MTSAKRRSRLAPEVRRDMILDVAARLVLDHGVSEVTMIRLGRDAGVSKGLIYAYFPTRNDVLAALLAREYARLSERLADSFRPGQALPVMVRSLAAAYIEHGAEHDLLIERLMNEPNVAETLRLVDATGRRAITELFAQGVAHELGVPAATAEIVASLLIGLASRADIYAQTAQADRKQVIDLTAGMMLAGLRELACAAPEPAPGPG